MQKLADTIKLMAKTGLFFANADGQYTDEEKKFITDFILGIEQIGEMEVGLKAQVMDTVNHSYMLEGIIEETNALLAGFTATEKDAIRKSLKAFVNNVIMADGTRCSAEQDNYLKWKDAIC